MSVIKWQPADERLGDRLKLELESGRWSEAWFVSAWARLSGVLRLRPAVRAFTAGGGVIHVVVGIDVRGTTSEALQLLVADYTTARVYYNPGPSSFHTKLYVLVGRDQALAFVGSNNLTGGGLYTNVETVSEIAFDLTKPQDIAEFGALRATIDRLIDPAHGPVRELDAALIADLQARGLVVAEAAASTSTSTGSGGGSGPAAGLFTHFPVPPPPPLPPSPFGPPPPAPGPATPGTGGGAAERPPTPPPTAAAATPPVPRTVEAFVMLLGPRDTRHTAGYSRDVYIPKAARDEQPDFWKWPHSFSLRATPGGKSYPERYVPVLLHPVGTPPVADDRRLYWYEDRTEFRFNAGTELVSGANSGDLIVFERASIPGREFEVSVVTPASLRYSIWLRFAVNAVQRSPKRWGYA